MKCTGPDLSQSLWAELSSSDSHVKAVIPGEKAVESFKEQWVLQMSAALEKGKRRKVRRRTRREKKRSDSAGIYREKAMRHRTGANP